MYIHRGIVDRTNQIWIYLNFCRFIVRGMVDRTSLIWNISPRSRITKRLYGSIRKFIVFAVCSFVHELPYQTTVVCCNSVFRRGYLRMDLRAVLPPSEWGSLSLAPTSTRMDYITRIAIWDRRGDRTYPHRI